MRSPGLLLAALMACAAFAQESYNAPRTPWGHPDIQGVWTNETITPFERPPALADKKFLTAEEAAEYEATLAKRRAAADGTSPAGGVGDYNRFWFDSGDKVLKTRQTSLVVDPANGRVPIRPEALAKKRHNRDHETDSYAYMSPWDRCITRGVPGSMFPSAYNNAYQILQTEDHVAIVYEMIHDSRIIPLADSPHVSDSIRLWMGDSRAHWEGDTLVVEVRNYSTKGWISTIAASGRIKGVPQSERLHVVERFTRTAHDTIEYELTVTDPEMYSSPWTLNMPFAYSPDYQMYEYACHEGNRAVELILGGARNLEKPADERK